MLIYKILFCIWRIIFYQDDIVCIKDNIELVTALFLRIIDKKKGDVY
jgi:hypothetical protein